MLKRPPTSTQSTPLAGRLESVSLPMLWPAQSQRCVAYRQGRAISTAEFLSDVAAARALLPQGDQVINLCEDRYQFLVGFCAAACAGQATLLPPSRIPGVVAEVRAEAGGVCAVLTDDPAGAVDGMAIRLPAPRCEKPQAAQAFPELAAELRVAVGYTSGSTGVPKAYPKTWRSFVASTRNNAGRLRDLLQEIGQDAPTPSILATVPAQHMYGMELSVLLPLIGGMAVHTAKPLFPADLATALAELPAPRILVTTPVHLRALVESRIALPELAVIVSATAPLSASLAQAAEQAFSTTVLEVFGSTETCVIASRRAARDEDWQLYPDFELEPSADGTWVSAPHFAAPVPLADQVELLPGRRFRLRGRASDMIEIAGKRASLADLTRRLLALPGVRDGVVVQLDAGHAPVRRVAALVVAPDLSEEQILEQLRSSVDPVFLPRPLLRVDSLPRNAVGKLPREALLALLTGR